jgi:hypothetical protein
MTTVSARAPGLTPALARLIGRTANTNDENCELCREPVSTTHRHVLDTDDGNLLCVCYACSILFNRPAASNGHFRLLPDRRVQLPHVSASELGVPVGLAFCVPQPDGEVLAHFPSPLGVTTGTVEPQRWATAVAACPILDSMSVSVEALLTNYARDHSEAWLAPLDDCYRLVALIRETWSGMSGGDAVWAAIDEFFSQLGGTHGSHQGR